MFFRNFITRGGLSLLCFIPFFNRGFCEIEPFESLVTLEAPRANDISFTSGEGFRLRFEAAPGEYDTEFSEDLKSWRPLSSITAPAGVGEFEDEAALGQPSGFYRIQGSFTAAGYHVLAPSFGIEFSGTAAEEEIGNLWAGILEEKASLQFKEGEEDARMVFPHSGLSVEGRISPLGASAIPAGRLLSLAQRKERDSVAVGFTSAGWNTALPALAAIPGRPLGNLYSEGSRVVPATTLEGNRDSLVGLEQRRSAIILAPDAENFLFGRREVVVPLMARKSVDADAERLDGPWGFVRFMIEAGSDSVRYSGGAYTFRMNAADGEMDFFHAAESAVDQTIPSGVAVTFESSEAALDLRFPFELKADGLFEFTADAGSPLKGFVSPSAKLFAVARSRPGRDSLESGETAILDDNPGFLEFQYGIGVRRELDPQLAGKTYRIVHHGFWVTDGWFDVGMKPRAVDERLTFSSDGSSARRTAYASFFRTSFSGESYEAQGAFSGEYEYDSVSMDSEGRLEIAGGISGEPDASVRLSGFAQEGGRVLILIDTVNMDQFGSGIGVAIAILEE